MPHHAGWMLCSVSNMRWADIEIEIFVRHASHSCLTWSIVKSVPIVVKSMLFYDFQHIAWRCSDSFRRCCENEDLRFADLWMMIWGLSNCELSLPGGGPEVSGGRVLAALTKNHWNIKNSIQKTRWNIKNSCTTYFFFDCSRSVHIDAYWIVSGAVSGRSD